MCLDQCRRLLLPPQARYYQRQDIRGKGAMFDHLQPAAFVCRLASEREVEKLIQAAKGSRWGQRDSAMLMMAFRHGLRASELCGLQWSDVEFASGTLHLRRAKGGQTSTHPLLGDEIRALRALKRDAESPFIFVSERGAPFSVSGLQKL